MAERIAKIRAEFNRMGYDTNTMSDEEILAMVDTTIGAFANMRVALQELADSLEESGVSYKHAIENLKKVLKSINDSMRGGENQ